MSKKANITVSFSWIFMIIVGVFFVILAYNFIGTYKDHEQAKYEQEFKQSLRTIFNNVAFTSGIEESSVYPIKKTLKNTKLELHCIENFPILSINGKEDPNNDFIKNNPAFMTYINQKEIDETYLIIENFRLPFKSTSLLAIVSKKNILIFDTNSKISIRFLDKINSTKELRNLSFYFKNLSNYSNTNFEMEFNKFDINSVTFIKDADIRSPLLNLNTLKNVEIANILEIREFETNKRYYGNITFIDKDSKKYSFPYIDYDSSMSLLIMAFYSQPQTFNCSYNLLLKKNIFSYNFYIQKAQILKNISTQAWTCSQSLSGFGTQVEIYQDMIDEMSAIKKLLSDSYDEGKFINTAQLMEKLKLLENKNKFLMSYNCKYIY